MNKTPMENEGGPVRGAPPTSGEKGDKEKIIDLLNQPGERRIKRSHVRETLEQHLTRIGKTYMINVEKTAEQVAFLEQLQRHGTEKGVTGYNLSDVQSLSDSLGQDPAANIELVTKAQIDAIFTKIKGGDMTVDEANEQIASLMPTSAVMTGLLAAKMSADPGVRSKLLLEGLIDEVFAPPGSHPMVNSRGGGTMRTEEQRCLHISLSGRGSDWLIVSP